MGSYAGVIPNIGDIRLYNQMHYTDRHSGQEIYSGEVQIYLSDGHAPSNWSKVCKTDSFDLQEAAILCSQLELTVKEPFSVAVG